MNTKVCSQCSKEKVVTEFYKRKNRPSGYLSECKECTKQRNLNRYKDNPDKINDMRAAKTYGISYDAVIKMREEANGVCKICGREGIKHHSRLVIDHCHATGKVRGLICSKCNTILGYCDDDPSILNKLSTYLEKNGSININTTTNTGVV